MTLHTILVSGVLKCITELPEKKFWPTGCERMLDNERALESAKNNAIPYEDQDSVWRLIFPDLTGDNFAKDFEVERLGNILSYRINNSWYCRTIQPNQIYSFDYLGRIEVVTVDMPKTRVMGQGYHITKGRDYKMIRLIPESKEESQERIIRDLLADYRTLEKAGNTHYSIELTLLDKFTITRKPLNHGK
jgi:hypothetical protein